MLVKELFKEVDQDKLLASLLREYPKERERIESGVYQKIISRIEKAKDRPNEEDRTICVEYMKDFGEANPNYIWQASYFLNGRAHYQYALKFISVEEVATANILKADLGKLSKEDYFAHLIFEIAHRDIVETGDLYMSAEKLTR